MRRLLLFACLALPVSALARGVVLDGTVAGEPDSAPLAGVEVSILEPPGLASRPATSDAAGRFRLELAVPEGYRHRSGYVVLRFARTGLRQQDIYQQCNLGKTTHCAAGTVGLAAPGGTSALSAGEQERLRTHIAAQGNALFLTPYRVIAAAGTDGIDMELFRWALETAINTRIQELEQDLEVEQLDAPLPPVGLVSLEPDFAGLPLPKQQAVGEFVSALAVISGIGQWKAANGAGEQVSIQSSFFVMPPAAGKQSRLLQVRDANLPAAAVNSIELADQLSPLWGHFALIAVAGREYERAAAANDRPALKRVRAYLIAERARLSKEDSYRKNDLERLLRHVQEALQR